ncbi:hypothetical protein V5738_08070 [Salinisphaera sp. SPP-AMP-43]|uniref:phosphotransferase n=1 Tax=Salinisphaera sp. SPP-AMP-43 TaxID=3121288 RepID=UPI003C6E52F7
MSYDIAGLVPHAGAMCLLDEVIAWSADRIHCRAGIDAAAEHPLAGAEGVPATALIEYAAQATAAHGTLLARAERQAGAPAAEGRLVALRSIELAAAPAEIAAAGTLDIHAERLMADPAGSIYRFRVLGGQRVLVSGRLTIRTVASGASARSG